jgi:hypothetical protein
MDFAAALKRIRELWEDGTYFLLPHARVRMEERGLDELDLQNVIRTGRVTQQIGDRFKIVGKSVEADTASCVVEIEDKLLVVTVILVRKRGEKRER